MAQDAAIPLFSKGQFSGHETFPLRYGWLKKVVDAISGENGSRKRADVFDTDHAIGEYGVGKNMVASMRHWAVTAGVVTALPPHDSLTELGEMLLGAEGLDPYLERPASLWLLHWKIATNDHRATTWCWAFNQYAGLEFERNQLVKEVAAFCHERGWRRISEGTIRRDVECFIRTYVVGRNKSGEVGEDSLECPLAELELIVPTGARSRYQFVRGAKPNLPDGVVNFALAEFWQRRQDSESLTLSAMAFDLGSPGRVFKLDESSLAERLSRIEETSHGAFRWSETAGLQQVHRVKPEYDPMKFLKAAYQPSRTRESMR